MDNSDLSKFVSDARAAGHSDADIRGQLMRAGWPEITINLAMAQAAMASTKPPLPTMTKGSDSSMWTAFEYVLMFISLAFSATGAAGLLHHLVDSKISVPTTAGSYYSLSYYSDYLVPFYISSLIVGFPIFAGLALRLRMLIEKNPEVRGTRVRKAAIYIALTWTFLAMLIKLVETVYGFVKGGVIVANVISNLAVTLVVSGTIFIYFASEIRKDSQR